MADRDLDAPTLAPLVDSGLLRRADGNVIPTERGMLVLNEVVAELA